MNGLFKCKISLQHHCQAVINLGSKVWGDLKNLGGKIFIKIQKLYQFFTCKKTSEFDRFRHEIT